MSRADLACPEFLVSLYASEGNLLVDVVVSLLPDGSKFRGLEASTNAIKDFLEFVITLEGTSGQSSKVSLDWVPTCFKDFSNPAEIPKGL